MRAFSLIQTKTHVSDTGWLCRSQFTHRRHFQNTANVFHFRAINRETSKEYCWQRLFHLDFVDIQKYFRCFRYFADYISCKTTMNDKKILWQVPPSLCVFKTIKETMKRSVWMNRLFSSRWPNGYFVKKQCFFIFFYKNVKEKFRSTWI